MSLLRPLPSRHCTWMGHDFGAISVVMQPTHAVGMLTSIARSTSTWGTARRLLVSGEHCYDYLPGVTSYVCYPPAPVKWTLLLHN